MDNKILQTKHETEIMTEKRRTKSFEYQEQRKWTLHF